MGFSLFIDQCVLMVSNEQEQLKALFLLHIFSFIIFNTLTLHPESHFQFFPFFFLRRYASFFSLSIKFIAIFLVSRIISKFVIIPNTLHGLRSRKQVSLQIWPHRDVSLQDPQGGLSLFHCLLVSAVSGFLSFIDWFLQWYQLHWKAIGNNFGV